MAHLVIGHALALVGLEQPVPPFGAGDDALHCVGEVVHRHLVGVAARGEDRGLVDEIGQVGTGEAGPAMSPRSSPAAVFTAFIWTLRIASRPLRSGR